MDIPKNFLQSFQSYGAPGGDNQLLDLSITGAASFLESLKTFYTFKDSLIEKKTYDITQPKNELGKILASTGSDKAGPKHRYDLVYQPIFEKYREVPVSILEIGLGTNNTDVSSNMGANGSVGASLKAYERYFKHARVFGADVDHRVLFQTDKIKTAHVDQLVPETFEQMHRDLGSPELDIFIEDGIHSVPGSLNSLNYALKAVKSGGWICLEDLVNPFGIWNVLATHMLNHFNFKSVELIDAGGGMLIIQK